MSEIMNHVVFISFSFKNKEKVLHVYERLTKRHGIPCWICTSDIIASEHYKSRVVQAISASSIVLLMQSAESVASRNVYNEINVAIHMGKPVIPFKLDAQGLAGDLLYELSAVHAIDGCGDDPDACIDELAEMIRRKLKALRVTQTDVDGEHHPEPPDVSDAAQPNYWDAFVNGPQPPAAGRQEQSSGIVTPPAQGVPGNSTPDGNPNDNAMAENLFTYITKGSYACITSGPDQSVVVIPKTLGGKEVISIAPGAFRNMMKLRRVIIPEGVVELGDAIFATGSSLYGGGLTALIPMLIAPPPLPHLLVAEVIRKLTAYWIRQRNRREINGVFAGCPLLEKVTIPSTLRFIGPHSFTMTTSLDELVLPDQLQEIDRDAFVACSKKLTLFARRDTSAMTSARRLRRGLDEDQPPFIKTIE